MTPSTLPTAATLAETAALIGDPARANMLLALMGGQALAAGELASHAGISAATASGHLARLMASRLVVVAADGRHRYYRLASPEVAAVLESLMILATDGPKRHRPPGPRDAAMRAARSCYDHLAGRLGVALADALAARGLVDLGDGGAMVTPAGARFFCDFGLDLAAGRGTRPLCRSCLDWSERRPHLGGHLGAALLDTFLARGWLARIDGTRALRLTTAGRAGLRDGFGINPETEIAAA